MKRALLAAVLVGGCKSREIAPEPSQKAPVAKVEKAPAPKAKPVIGTSLTAVACQLTDKPRDGSNNVAATRHLHRGPRNELYFFPDFLPPTVLEPIADGCGYRSAGAMSEKPGHDFALQPDGAIVLVPRSDESKNTACRTRALSSLRYGHGALVGSTYYYRDTGTLMRMKLDDEQCTPEEVTTLKELPADGLTKARVGQSGNDLLVAIPRQDWKWAPELFRFDASGKFVRKYGAAEGKGELHGELTGCGDGLCASAYMNQLEIYDREGMRVGGASLTTLTKLNGVYIGGIVDVPDKGVYVLIGHQPQPKGDGRAEVVRIDGVY
ncbi:MAG: hypothetical protein ACXVEF_25060 [Polyangiales bacterium]